ncbi:hypothetical protein V1460_30245 [Streptomyces sp. SCSIO 30461]|uniref:hypothetical protein n=1 Tax=Streptomyces sp. SCSIO 30461 TaxID=3118085 RepID=UPI0030D38BD4
MRTCRKFTQMRGQYERDIAFLTAHSKRHAGRPAAKSSATHAGLAKARMARVLAGHVQRCPECM